MDKTYKSTVSEFHTSILTNPKTKGIYILPDAVYTSGDYKSVEFKAIFGNIKTNPYNSSNKYFYFYTIVLLYQMKKRKV